MITIPVILSSRQAIAVADRWLLNCSRILLISPECLRTLDKSSRIWGEEDSNLRRLSRQIYSLIPLTARVSPRFRECVHKHETSVGLNPR